MTQDMLNKLIIFTVHDYVERQLQSDVTTYNVPQLKALYAKLHTYRSTHKFTLSEAKIIMDLSKNEAINKLTTTQIDYSIYALELITLWVKMYPKNVRPALFYSDKKILALRSKLTMDMLGLKRSDSKRIEEIDEIVKTSKLVAKQYIHLIDNQVHHAI